MWSMCETIMKSYKYSDNSTLSTLLDPHIIISMNRRQLKAG